MQTLTGELLRPQFHFSARRFWLNDPNGLVFFQGHYHLFFQHNPHAMTGAGINMHWGHAQSPDLLHWQELPVAPGVQGEHQAWSGSAVVDWANTTGFGTSDEPALVAIYTRTGRGQSLAWSRDRGHTWTEYENNPVLPASGDDRDPKAFWHRPTSSWVVVLYEDDPREGEVFAFYTSPDLKTWTKQGFQKGFYECPDLFELPVEGSSGETRWVLVDGSGDYEIGSFDGREFVSESGRLRGDLGRNFYATQTWNEVPASDGRRLQIAWMRDGQYPEMPFSQQMTFPCEVTLHQTPEGLRLRRRPAREIQMLWADDLLWRDDLRGDLWHIRAVVAIQEADEIAFSWGGQTLRFSRAQEQLHVLGASLSWPLVEGCFEVELLLDRTSLELFGQGGQIAASFCFVPEPGEQTLSLVASSAVRVVSLEVHPLRSVWA